MNEDGPATTSTLRASKLHRVRAIGIAGRAGDSDDSTADLVWISRSANPIALDLPPGSHANVVPGACRETGMPIPGL